MTRYFVETTAHLERHTGDAPRREAIEQRLRDGLHASSSHVFREWKRILDGTAVDILNVIQEGAADLQDVFARLSQGWGREAGQRLRVLGMLAGPELDMDLLKMRAEVFLRSESQELFMDRIDEVRDGPKCGLAGESVRLEAGGRRSLRTSCKKTECVCVQPGFLEIERHASAIAAASSLLRLDKEFQAMARHTDAVMAKPNSLDRKGKNCWGPLGLGGDISIALECRCDETLLTTDRSFEVMAPGLGLTVERVAATPQP